MIHKDPFIIAPQTLNLIKELQVLPELSDFYLVGGTSLALQIGHRNSIDIDLFTVNDFDVNLLLDVLNQFYTVQQIYIRKNTLLTFINNVKVDFITHKYEIIKPIIFDENIRMLSMQDICAMKLNAIVDSGQRLKDFLDVYFLLEYFSVKQMVGFYQQKYPNKNEIMALRALTYFDDLDLNIDPPIMHKIVTIDQIKDRILNGVMHSNKIFK